MFLLAQIRDNIHPLIYEQFNEYMLCKRAYLSKCKITKRIKNTTISLGIHDKNDRREEREIKKGKWNKKQP